MPAGLPVSRLIEEEIRCAVRVAAPRERVYDALATAAGLDGWFTAGAVVEARPGGEIRFRWKEWGPERYTGEDGGPVLEARRPERFVFQWHPDGPEYATTVEIELEEDVGAAGEAGARRAGPGGTVVRLREYGYRDTPSGRRRMLDCASGWGEALALCKFYVEHGLRY